MKFSPCALVVLAIIVLSCYVDNSKAQSTEVLRKVSELGKYVTGREFQSLAEAMIMARSDNISLAAQNTIKAIRKIALKRQPDEVAQAAMDDVIESILATVRFVAIYTDLANKILDPDMTKVSKDPDALIDEINNAIMSLSDIVYTLGVLIEDSHGYALAVAGGSNREQMKNSMNCIQVAGNTILEVFTMAIELATTGITIGGIAAQDGLKAARSTVTNGAFIAFENEYKSATKALEGTLQTNLNDEESVDGLMESLRSNQSDASSKGITISLRLLNILNLRINLFRDQPGKRAANVMTRALSSTVMEVSRAIAIANNKLKEAERLASTNKTQAIWLVRNATYEARENFLDSATYAFLGFGSARKVSNGTDMHDLVAPMIEIIRGRVQAVDNMKLAEKVAINGIRAGGSAIAKGIKSASEICDAAGSALYTQFENAEKVGLTAFTKPQ